VHYATVCNFVYREMRFDSIAALIFFCLVLFSPISAKNLKRKRKSKSKTRTKLKKSKNISRTNEYINLFDEPHPGDVISDYAIVFSWHSVGREVNDVRWDSPTVGRGNEFKVAVLSCKEAHPDIPIYFFTNVKSYDATIRPNLHRAYQVDLLKESKVDKIIEATGDSKFGFISKAQSLLTGWSWGVLPERVIHLDVDIVLMSSDEGRDLHTVFRPLDVRIRNRIYEPPCVQFEILYLDITLHLHVTSSVFAVLIINSSMTSRV